MARHDPHSPVTLPAFFADIAARAPDRVALEIPAGKDRPQAQALTYAELDDQSDRIALHLAPRLGGEGIVALLLPRTSPLLYVAQLAVLIAGGAFTCLDPSFPDERMQEILDDAAPVAETVCFLLSDHARAITGELLHVDGGFNAMATAR